MNRCNDMDTANSGAVTIGSLRFPTLYDTDVHYFDYAATTFMPQCVMQAWQDINTACGVFIGRGSGILARRADEILHHAEAVFSAFFDLSEDYQYLYAKNVTEAINIIALGLEQQLEPLDIIAVGCYEHHSNYLPWKRLAEKTGALFCEIPVDSGGNPDYGFIARYRDRIKILSVSAVSNSFGYETDLDRICAEIGTDTMLFVDQSQVSAHRPINNSPQIGAHFLSSHKMYGPKNIALAAVRKDLLAKLEPVILGGGMVESVGFSSAWLPGREKFMAGTMDIGLIGAWAEACRFVEAVGYRAIADRDRILSCQIRERLRELRYERVAMGDRCVDYIISFSHPSIHAHDVNELLSARNVLIRSGNLCSQNALRKLGNNAINRISLGLGITDKDIKLLCNALGDMYDV